MMPGSSVADESGQFTAAQILASARRAEADGNRDHALRFYAYVVQTFAGTPEATQSRASLQRLDERSGNRGWSRTLAPQSAYAAPLLSVAPNYSSDARLGSSGAPSATALLGLARQFADPHAPQDDGPTARDRSSGVRSRRRRRPAAVAKPPAPVKRYRTGRFLAGLVSIAGSIGIIFGCGAIAASALLPASRTANTIASVLFSSPWIAATFTGASLLLLLLGLIGRAVFEMANTVNSQATASEHDASADGVDE